MDAQSFLTKISDQSVTVIDVRSAQEHAEGHLANSININVESDLFSEQIANLDKEKEYPFTAEVVEGQQLQQIRWLQWASKQLPILIKADSQIWRD